MKIALIEIEPYVTCPSCWQRYQWNWNIWFVWHQFWLEVEADHSLILTPKGRSENIQWFTDQCLVGHARVIIIQDKGYSKLTHDLTMHSHDWGSYPVKLDSYCFTGFQIWLAQLAIKNKNGQIDTHTLWPHVVKNTFFQTQKGQSCFDISVRFGWVLIFQPVSVGFQYFSLFQY